MGGDQVAPTAAPPDGIVVGEDAVARCWWGSGDPLYRRYHDTEWGRPVAEDRRLFEKLSLEGFQAGLSWLTILRKREHFRRAFDGALLRSGDLRHVGGCTCPEDQIAKASPANATASRRVAGSSTASS